MAAPRPNGSIDIWNFVDNVTGVTVRKWLRDSWARRKIVALQQAVANIVVPTRTSQLTNDSGYITASALPSVPSASTTNPAMDGTGAAGSSADYARADHVHPHDTSKQDALSAAQLAAVNSGITADDLAVNNASVLCSVTPIEPTLLAGAHYDTYGRCYYYKIGHKVHVHIGVSGLTNGSTATLWEMPAGYLPRTAIAAVGNGGGMATYGRLRIGATGSVYVNANATSALIDIEYEAFS